MTLDKRNASRFAGGLQQEILGWAAASAKAMSRHWLIVSICVNICWGLGGYGRPAKIGGDFNKIADMAVLRAVIGNHIQVLLHSWR